jgi:hypothetical protein
MSLKLIACTLVAGLASAQTCTFTVFGRACGGTLTGQQVATPNGSTIRLDVTNAAPLVVAVLAAGPQQRPVDLPGSPCTLIVDPRVTFFSQTDRQGQAVFRFPIPATIPFATELQVVTVGVDRRGRTAESTNALHLTIR